MPSAPATTLVVCFPGCAYLEVAAAVAWQSAHGPVVFVSPGGAGVTTGDGVPLAPAADFRSAREGSSWPPRLVLVPGGELDAVAEDESLAELLRAAAAEGAVVGGVCNGVLLLARAGLLAGRRCTHTAVAAYAPRPDWAALRDHADPLLSDSIYVDRPVVVDGRVVTAKPWAAIAFAAEVAVAAGTDSPTSAGRRAAYLRGERLPADGAQTHYAIRLAGRPRAEIATPLVNAHIEYLRELDRRGQLVLAGPLRGENAGLVVVRAADREAAEAIAAADPFVAHGVRAATISVWDLSTEANAHMGVATGPRGG